MTEQPGTGLTSADPSSSPAAVPAVTGHPEVDGVLESLEALSDLPVEQHVTVFETAHARLRDALSGAAQAPEPTRG